MNLKRTEVIKLLEDKLKTVATDRNPKIDKWVLNQKKQYQQTIDIYTEYLNEMEKDPDGFYKRMTGYSANSGYSQIRSIEGEIAILKISTDETIDVKDNGALRQLLTWAPKNQYVPEYY